MQPVRDRSGKPLLVPKWLDLCPFWDVDGKAYLIASKPNGAWYPHLFRMSWDGTALLDADAETMALPGVQLSGEGALIYSRKSAEGSKIYKKDGLYYFFNNEVSWQGRMAVMRRSRFIYGERVDGSPGTAAHPGAYQVKPMLETHARNREINQGGLVDTPDGRWYFLTHGGLGGFADGRVVSLLPVRWIDGWPIAGDDADGDGVGDMVWSGEVPVKGGTISYPQGSDDFSSLQLLPRWEWNHQPRAEYWSLTERPGWLRLRAFRPLATDSFFKAGNTLGQRYLSADKVQVTVQVDVSGLAHGQKAGLAQFNGGKNYSALRLALTPDALRLEVVVDDRVMSSHEIDRRSDPLWLRTDIDQAHRAQFSYSTNGKTFTTLSGSSELKWGGYRGAYLGLFTYNDAADKGYLDINSFEYRFEPRPTKKQVR